MILFGSLIGSHLASGLHVALGISVAASVAVAALALRVEDKWIVRRGRTDRPGLVRFGPP